MNIDTDHHGFFNDAEHLRAYRWIVAQEGSRQSYAVPQSFHRLQQLRLFYTDVWCRWGRQILLRGPAGTRALSTRYNRHIPPELVVPLGTRAIFAKVRQHFQQGRMSPEAVANEWNRYGQWFACSVRDRIAKLDLDPQVDHFLGFNSNCLEILEFLKEQKIFTLVDQVDPGKVEEDLVIAEASRWPGWEKLPGRLPEEYWHRVKAEWATASMVLVNSDWSKKALIQQEVAEDRIIVVPLAIDLSQWRSGPPMDTSGPLRVLWIGSVLLRKGIQYLVEAARLLENERIEFTVAGPVFLSDEVVKTFPSNIELIGRVTRSQLSTLYRQGHVFVLPTLSDGFAVTQLEAMSHGLPVVTTPNCGPVVENGVDGLIVPAADGKALAGALARLNSDRKLLAEMSQRALEKVRHYDLPQNALLINKLIHCSKTEKESKP